MGSSLLITLREGLEIGLVLAIIAAYLHKSGRADRLGSMWVGTAAAAAVCIATALLFHVLVGEFEGKWEQCIEGALALLAVAVLTWMVFWMRGHARGMTSDLHRRIDRAVDGSSNALAVMAFVAVVREGFEMVLFLLGAETASASGTEVVVGGLIGLALAAVLGYLFYLGSDRVDLRRFFTWTGLLLILFGAGLFAKGVHEFREFLELESAWYSKPVWELTSGPLAEGSTVHDFLKGLFGWSPDPERVRVAAYVAYLVPTLWLYFGGATKPARATASVPESDTSVPA